MKRIVSVSIGSSKGDKKAEVEYLGERFSIERVGTDGDLERARAMIAELDGKVDAIGLGGIDLYVVAAGHRYVFQDARRMASGATRTPIVDGSGLKAAWEPEVLRRVVERGLLHPAQATRGLAGLNILIPSAVDRFGLAQALAATGASCVFGDLMFALGLPIKLTRLSQVAVLARLLMPLIGRLPFHWVYPTGEKQEKRDPRYRTLFDWADVIAGDKHFITRYMPAASGDDAPLKGKTVVTNTVRHSDVEDFRVRGLSRMITTTPEIEGESMGTNAMQGVIVALLGKHPDELTPQDYVAAIDRIGWQPWVLDF